MGLLDTLKGLFKGLDYGNVDPGNVEHLVRLEHGLLEEGRKGDAALAALLAKYGMKDVAHAEKVMDAMRERHGASPEFHAALQRVRDEHQAQMMSAAMKGPPQS